MSDDGTSTPSVAQATGVVVGMALLFAGFNVWLYLDGHQPSFTGNGLPAPRYYLWQALYMVPLMVAGWWVFGVVAHAVSARLGGGGQRRESVARLGVCYGGALGALYVAPDVVAYALGGFDALLGTMRVTAPLCFIALVATSAAWLRRGRGLSMGRALFAVGVGLMAQAAVVVPWLR